MIAVAFFIQHINRAACWRAMPPVQKLLALKTMDGKTRRQRRRGRHDNRSGRSFAEGLFEIEIIGIVEVAGRHAPTRRRCGGAVDRFDPGRSRPDGRAFAKRAAVDALRRGLPCVAKRAGGRAAGNNPERRRWRSGRAWFVDRDARDRVVVTGLQGTGAETYSELIEASPASRGVPGACGGIGGRRFAMPAIHSGSKIRLAQRALIVRQPDRSQGPAPCQTSTRRACCGRRCGAGRELSVISVSIKKLSQKRLYRGASSRWASIGEVARGHHAGFIGPMMQESGARTPCIWYLAQ